MIVSVQILTVGKEVDINFSADRQYSINMTSLDPERETISYSIRLWTQTQLSLHSFYFHSGFFLTGSIITEFKQTTMAMATGTETSINKRLNEQYNGCTCAL